MSMSVEDLVEVDEPEAVVDPVDEAVLLTLTLDALRDALAEAVLGLAVDDILAGVAVG